jgi:molybdenum cofactor guanylyltransferase
MQHKKHPSTSRQKFESWASHEWAILGTHCDTIRNFARQIYENIKDDFSVAYLDASHSDKAFASFFPEEWVEEQGLFTVHGKKLSNAFQKQLHFQNIDLLLVNGNHHAAHHQIVFLDKAKENSLRKRKDQLTDILVFVSLDQEEPWDFLRELAPLSPVIPWEGGKNVSKIVSAIQPKLPSVYALVLAGGQSSRMGRDKSELLFHDKRQWEYLVELLSPLAEQVYISRRAEQNNDFQGIPVLTDSFLGAGPLGAILSAFRHEPKVAWLVISIDMPGVVPSSVSHLLAGRRASAHATAFHNAATGFPDPLFTIYEPKSYLGLLSTLGMGYTCPRKFLINSEVQVLNPLSASDLTNVNTPEEWMDWQKKRGK